MTALSRLIRFPLSAMVAISALTGALAADPHMSGITLWSLAWGIFLLSSACSVFNQVQERATDALMRRTCQRPLACGAITATTGIAIGVILGSGGLAILLATTGAETALLGLLATGWYLLVYTPLKKRSALAVIAGTPCGALPPLMGWLAAGGNLFDPQPLALALLMVLWQVPHYWLLALPDRQELKRVGFRMLPVNLTGYQLLSLSHFWILGMVAATFLLSSIQLVQLPILQAVVTGIALAFAVWATRTHKKTPFAERVAAKLRVGLHIYLGLILGSILLSSLIIRLTF